MSEFLEDFKDRIKVNKFRLDDEAESQSALYWEYAEQLARKKAERDRVRAKTEMLIRENSDKRLPIGVKLTESTVEALLKSDPVLSVMDSEVRLLEAAVGAIEDRRSQLKNLTELYIAGYYSVPEKFQAKPEEAVRQEMRDRLNHKNQEEKEE